MTEMGLEEIALALFRQVHGRLGHEDYARATRSMFDSNPPRKAAWTEIARALDERFAPTSRWLDDYAFALFDRIHSRAGEIGDLWTRRSFEEDHTYRRRMWHEVARVLAERIENG